MITAVPYGRLARGAFTVVVATAACHTVMSAGYAWARDRRVALGDTLFAGSVEFLLTTAASWMLMPLLLWVGMRVAGQRRNGPLVLIGGLTWVGISGYFIDDIDHPGGHMPFLAIAAFVLLGTALSTAGRSGR